ncbi:Bifunctional purine biosynthetic protein [Venturia inaequalis]|nr:Bifunctional purine biosynthetic protein [Venturia inaequalis]
MNDRDVVLRSTSVKKYQTRPILKVVADFDVNSSDSNPNLDELS